MQALIMKRGVTPALVARPLLAPVLHPASITQRPRRHRLSTTERSTMSFPNCARSCWLPSPSTSICVPWLHLLVRVVLCVCELHWPSMTLPHCNLAGLKMTPVLAFIQCALGLESAVIDCKQKYIQALTTNKRLHTLQLNACTSLASDDLPPFNFPLLQNLSIVSPTTREHALHRTAVWQSKFGDALLSASDAT